MYQNSPILGLIALIGLMVCASATAVICVLWVVERYWIPQNMTDESWLYGEDADGSPASEAAKAKRPAVRSMAAEIHGIRPEDCAPVTRGGGE